jgi:outer membrane protein, heavy metal efflux system
VSCSRNAVILAAFVSIASAQTPEPLRLPGLIAEALANNPEIQAAQKRYEAARQRPSQERSLPDPTLSVGYASNGGPLPGQGLGSNPTSNIGVTVSQEFPYPGKRRLRGDIASKEADAAFQQYQAVELSVRSRLDQAVHRLHHTYDAVAILERGRDLIEQMIRASEIRYTAGKAMQQDIFKAQTQRAMLQVRIERMLQDRRAAEAEINSLVNRQPGSSLGEPVMEDALPLSMTLEELMAKTAGTSPELKRDQKMIERNEAAVNLARKDFHSDYTVSAGYFNQGGMSPMYQVRVDIPIRFYAGKKQHPALNEKVDLLQESRRNFETADQSLAFRVREAYTSAETAWRLIQLYKDTVLPQSQLTVEASLLSYENAAGDFVSVLNNLTTSVDVEEQLHEEELNYVLALARLEEMTGVALNATGRDTK